MRILMVSDVYFPRVNGVSTSIETFRHTLAGQPGTPTRGPSASDQRAQVSVGRTRCCR